MFRPFCYGCATIKETHPLTQFKTSSSLPPCCCKSNTPLFFCHAHEKHTPGRTDVSSFGLRLVPSLLIIDVFRAVLAVSCWQH